MRLSDFILALVHEHGQNGCAGRTRVQKEIYFLLTRLRWPVGASYQPHYYGPYSEEVSVALQSLVAQNLLEEKVVPRETEGPFEGRSYHYSLTEDGKKLVAAWQADHRDEAKELSDTFAEMNIGRQSIPALAVASKIHYVVAEADTPVPKKGLVSRAGRFGWRVGNEESERAVDFLIQSSLVKTAKRTSKQSP